MKKLIILSAVLLSLSLSSCKKYLDIEPVGRVIPTTAEDFRALLNAGYAGFAQHKSLLAARTDELVLNEFNDDFPLYRDIYKWNDINPDVLSIQFHYIDFYRTIFNANTVISDVEARAGVNTETAQLKGEAYLLRAYSHFELLNLYAKPYDKNTAATDRGIPLSLKVDLEHIYTPATVAVVYDQVLADIAEGQKLLNVKTFEAGKNYRFTTRAAFALLARVREFRGEYAEALKASKDALALDNQLEDLNAAGAVLPNNYLAKENIMSMESPFNNGINRLARISAHLIGLYNQTDDLRFAKYFSKSGSNYVALKGASDANKISFRNGELYLIQAEAALQTNDQALAVQSLLALKAKRLTPAYYTTEATRISALDKNALLQEILVERERELALEGQRWYDLRRYGQPQITHTVGGEAFILQKNDPRYTIRFPKDAIANNPNLQ
ncbi:RagB/SusD family nutrient uptake outer membrane protein [Pedobacter nyackensis]|uniref:SusD family protein n=1 Tax=Pedobacter nyackensis TaxID=475255 RepID=A0A1W2B0U5_9SPHI|nr:RagB/SusD family nutrient uptake outer membrane protein [Pedobacter nyackensis]SMC66494.1 SusD family protein [Pedobacter nyackensis]